MNELIDMRYEGRPVRVHVDENGDPWWVAKDVCRVLGIINARDAIGKGLDADERCVAKIYPPSRPDGVDVNVINESGLYTLIIRSNKPEARKFRRWVTHEVLPQIRRTGAYRVGGHRPGRTGNGWTRPT